MNAGIRNHRRRKERRDEREQEEKRSRTAFTPQQLNVLRNHFIDNRYAILYFFLLIINLKIFNGEASS